jgi:nicotinate-nucleotide pyrophosphorylase (carboxylating)
LIIRQAVARARQLGGFSLKIEVEARNHDEAIRAANAGANIVMLDNFEAKVSIQALAHIITHL